LIETADLSSSADVLEETLGQIQPEQLEADPTLLRMDVEGMLDPRSAEFQEAVRMTPATLAFHRTKGKWSPAEHLLFVSSILAAEISRGDARIIVEIPPRHGKSEEISVHTPIWFLEKFPWASVILSTYAESLSTGFGRRVRDAFLINEEGFLRTQVRDDVAQTGLFLTTEGGGMTSVGIGGPITGRGAHLLIVDDYIKNWIEASSEISLNAIWNWFISTAYTRLEPGGSCVILATRWVVNDLIGRLKEQDKERMWTIIRMPALAEQGDVLNRQIGEALWPQRYPREKLLKIKQVIGDFMFNGLYQQDPKEAKDVKTDVEQLRIWDDIPQPQRWRWVRSWDLAASELRGDWTVGSLVGTDGRAGSPLATTCIAEQVREQWGPGKLELEIRKVAERDGTGIPIVIEQEPGSSGKIAATHLSENVLKGFSVTVTPSGGNNKWIRAQPYLAAVTNGRVALIRAAWNEQHKKELRKFPSTQEKDDTVDSAAQGFNHLHQTKILVPTWGRSSAESIGNTIRGTATKRLVGGVVFGRSVDPHRNRNDFPER